MAIRKKIFFNLLRNTFDSFDFECDKPLVVVSFFGKTFWDFNGCKYEGFKSLPKKVDYDPALPCIDGLFNPETNVLYLQLTGVLDVNNLLQTLSSSSTELNEKGYLSVWADLKIRYAKTLYLLISVSHLVVLCHPVAVIDTSYLHLFKALDLARETCVKGWGHELSGLGVDATCKENGRLCSPRILFRFFSSPERVTDVTHLEHALEDQLYELMIIHKFVGQSSGASLFSIPANQEFVFVDTAVDRPGSRVINAVQNIVKQCLRPPALIAPITMLDRLTVDYDLKQQDPVHTFECFLQTHINVVSTKGLDENLGKQSSKNPCFQPTLKQWLDLVKVLRPLTVECAEDTPFTSAIRSCIDIDRQFSEGRCAKVLPLALKAYQENAPPHYPRRYHESKLAQALSVLAMQGRGAMLDKYVTLLERQCNEHWRSGRQMCETLSLTGHSCINALHRGGGDGAGGGELKRSDSADGQTEEDSRKAHETLDDKDHCSGVRYISACNCGRKQGSRSDPYTLKAANFEFYRSLASECGCEKLENFKFPVFQPSVKDYRAAQLLGRRESLALIRGDAPRSQIGGGTQHEAFSLAFVSGSVHGSCDVVETRLSCLRTQHPDILILTNQPGEIRDKDKGLVRQASTTEYLPGMLHTESPSGLLPQFASWSLLCVGASSVYSHNLGLNDQPGLLTGSSYLLPWDVTVRLQHQKNPVWPTVADSKRSNSQIRVRKHKGEQSEMVVKIFVGVEYECTRGHRFMTASPDKVLKTGPSGQVRDTGHKIAASDLPLYFPCPCSKPSKPVVAQLMRLHVVTPKAPVRVTLNPKVQPTQSAPIFIGCHDQPIPLSPSTYWVMRLPYVYMTDRTPFVAPLELPNLQYGRLLAGAFGITEIPPDKTP